MPLKYGSTAGRALRRSMALFAALAVMPAAADAATYNLRPDGQTLTGWTVTPSGPQWDALNDPVVQPALPSTLSDYLSTAPNVVSQTELTLEAAAIPAGESVTGATAWVYAQTGTTRNLVVWVTHDTAMVGTVTLPVNSPAGWYPVPITVPLTQAQVNALKIGFTHNGNSGTHTLVYATYVQLDVSDPPPPPPSDPPPSDPPPADPPVVDPPVLPPADVPPVVTTTPTTPVVPDVTVPPVSPPVDPPVVKPPTTGTDDVVEPALAIVGQNPTATASGVVPVEVSCPETEVDGCEGTMWLEEALAAGSTSQSIRSARRAPKRFSRPKKYKLRKGAKKTVPVRLDRRVHRKFKSKRSFKVTVVAQQKDSTGQVLAMRRTVRVFTPPPKKKPKKKKGRR